MTLLNSYLLFIPFIYFIPTYLTDLWNGITGLN